MRLVTFTGVDVGGTRETETYGTAWTYDGSTKHLTHITLVVIVAGIGEVGGAAGS